MIYEGRKIEAFVLDRLTQLIKNSTCLDAAPSPWTCLWRLMRPCWRATMFCTWRIIIHPLLFSAWKPLPEYFNDQIRVLRICLPSPHENSYKVDARADGETKITGLLTWRQQACRGRPNESARDLKRSDGNSRCGEKKKELIPSGSCPSSHLTKTARNVSHVWIHTAQSLFSDIIDCFQTRRLKVSWPFGWSLRFPPATEDGRHLQLQFGKREHDPTRGHEKLRVLLKME